MNAEFSRIYRFVKLMVNEGFLAVYMQMYTTQNLHRSQQLPLLSTWLERSTPRLCFLNALRLVKFLSSLLTFDQMKGPFETIRKKAYL